MYLYVGYRHSQTFRVSLILRFQTSVYWIDYWTFFSCIAWQLFTCPIQTCTVPQYLLTMHLPCVCFSDTGMEFLDISLTKDLSLLLHAIHSPFYWHNFKEKNRYSTLDLKIQYMHAKKSTKQEVLHESLSMLKFIPRNLDQKGCSRIRIPSPEIHQLNFNMPFYSTIWNKTIVMLIAGSNVCICFF